MTSVTGRHNQALFLVHIPLCTFYSLRIQERISQVARTGIIGQSFSYRPSPNRACSFHCTRLSGGTIVFEGIRFGFGDTHLTYLLSFLSLSVTCSPSSCP